MPLPDQTLTWNLQNDTDDPELARQNIHALMLNLNETIDYLTNLLGATGEANEALQMLGIAQASEDDKGVVELATLAEAATGDDDTRALTPASIKPLLSNAGQATKEAQGIVEVATNAEVAAGTDDERAITPAGIAGRIATVSITGVVEMATTLETEAGVDTTRAANCIGVKNIFDDYLTTARAYYEQKIIDHEVLMHGQ